MIGKQASCTVNLIRIVKLFFRAFALNNSNSLFWRRTFLSLSLPLCVSLLISFSFYFQSYRFVSSHFASFRCTSKAGRRKLVRRPQIDSYLMGLVGRIRSFLLQPLIAVSGRKENQPLLGYLFRCCTCTRREPVDRERGSSF